MTRRPGVGIALVALLSACAGAALVPAGDRRDPKAKSSPCDIVDEPGGTTESAGLAVGQPDEYAWRLFLFINRQALPGCAGVADPAKPSVKDYDDDTDVVWESWALASSDAQPDGSEVFLAAGAKPQPWDKLDRGRRAATKKKLDINLLVADHRLLTLGPAGLRSAKRVEELLRSLVGEVEVRFNRATFDTIRDNGYYSREGLVDAFAKAQAADDRDFIKFPPAAKAVKAAWRPISEADKPNYHWRTIDGQTFGLKALHVISRDLPLWFWCDFIHTSVEQDEPIPSHDTTTRGPCPPHGKNGVRDETVGSKWANYRLKGSQIAFTDAHGKATLLGNQVLENSETARASCISCHAMARIDAQAKGKGPAFPPVGVPDPDSFGATKIEYLQTSFLYSLVTRTHSTAEPAP
jgi:hypothetical protein